jgi:Ca2+-binding RTX toxin-like protein
VDTITDFLTGIDSFELSLAIFAGLQSTGGVLDDDNFLAGVGAVATTANQHIIFDTATGALYYDLDGSGAGAQIEFANIGVRSVVASDFLVV